jgi:hypothetical protein
VAVCREISIGSRRDRKPSDGSAATDGDRAFVERWTIFDGDVPHREEPAGTLRGWFGNGSNRPPGTLGNRPSGFPKAVSREVGGRSQDVSG